jgi:hypothetical protein
VALFLDKPVGALSITDVRLAPFLEDRLRVLVIAPVLSGGLIAYYAAVGNEVMRETD